MLRLDNIEAAATVARRIPGRLQFFPALIAAGDVLSFLAAVVLTTAVFQHLGLRASELPAFGGVEFSLVAFVLFIRAGSGAYRLPLGGPPGVQAVDAAVLVAAVASIWIMTASAFVSIAGNEALRLLVIAASGVALTAASTYGVGQMALSRLGPQRAAPRAILISDHADRSVETPLDLATILPSGPVALVARAEAAAVNGVRLARLVDETDAKIIVVDLSSSDSGLLSALLAVLADLDLRIWLIRRDGARSAPRAVLLRAPFVSSLGSALKRALDLSVAVLALLTLLPVLIAIAIAIRIDSPGSVFYRQVREGRNGRRFAMLKFRSMQATANKPGTLQLTARADPRLTRVGRFIRSTSLDELPQLFNVLIGDMSLVGPRPLPPDFAHEGVRFEDVIPSFRARLAVKPGITGLAQLRGQRGTPECAEQAVEAIAERVKSDLEYINKWSFWLDLRILLATLLGGAWLSKAY